MNILFVTHQFFPEHITGTERLTLDLGKQIQRLGHKVTVLTYEPNSQSEGFEPLDFHILKKEYDYDGIHVISFKRKLSLSGFYIFDPLIEQFLENIVHDFDIVHFTHPMRLSSVFKICDKLKVPTVLTLTDNWLLCPRGLLTVDLELCNGPEDGKKCMAVCKYKESIISRYNDAQYFFNGMDQVFSGSHFVKNMFEENGWNREIKINTFSVDYAYVKPRKDPNEIVFGFIGSLIWQKGLHVLLEAFKKVKSDKVKLKIYGKGVERDFYPKRIQNMIKKDKRVEFCGTFDYAELPTVMEKFSVIVIPSVYLEIYPLVMQMGLAYKKPVIASKIGGIPEVIQNNVNGLLFDPGDVDKLSKIISLIDEKPTIINELKNQINPPPRIEEEALIYENTYKELIEKRLHK